MKTTFFSQIPWSRREHKAAFTRLELMAVLASLFLLLVVASPLFAQFGPRSERAICVNNLRVIARAHAIWTQSHDNLMPWQIPSPVGTQNHPLFENVWFQLFAVADEIGSPRVLADPGDKRAALRVAKTWDNNPNGGIRAGAYGNNAVSYALGLKATPWLGQSLVAADRNLQCANKGGFASGFVSVAIITPEAAAWTNEVHGLQGNLAFMDGHVEQADNAALREAIAWKTNWNHAFLMPF